MAGRALVELSLVEWSTRRRMLQELGAHRFPPSSKGSRLIETNRTNPFCVPNGRHYKRLCESAESRDCRCPMWRAWETAIAKKRIPFVIVRCWKDCRRRVKAGARQALEGLLTCQRDFGWRGLIAMELRADAETERRQCCQGPLAAQRSALNCFGIFTFQKVLLRGLHTACTAHTEPQLRALR